MHALIHTTEIQMKYNWTVQSSSNAWWMAATDQCSAPQHRRTEVLQ